MCVGVEVGVGVGIAASLGDREVAHHARYSRSALKRDLSRYDVAHHLAIRALHDSRSGAHDFVMCGRV